MTHPPTSRTTGDHADQKDDDQPREAFVELLPPDVGYNLRHQTDRIRIHATGEACHCRPERIPHSTTTPARTFAAEPARDSDVEADPPASPPSTPAAGPGRTAPGGARGSGGGVEGLRERIRVAVEVNLDEHAKARGAYDETCGTCVLNRGRSNVIADAVLAVVAPELDRLSAEVKDLQAEIDALPYCSRVYYFRELARANAAEAEVKRQKAALAAERAKVAEIRAVADEHKRLVTPAPYTTERALIERIEAALADEPSGGEE